MNAYLRYPDPSGMMPSIYVLEIRNERLKIRVAGQEMIVVPGQMVTLWEDGKNYTDFELSLGLDQIPGPNTVDLDDVLALARDRYKVFALSPEQIETLKQSENKNDMFLLGRWYWLTYPERGCVGIAKELFSKAADAGCPDALMGLANICRYGAPSEEKTRKYVKLRDEARKKGSLMADLAFYLDMASGYGCEADPVKAEELLGKQLGPIEKRPAEWFDVQGRIMLEQGRKQEAISKFATAGIRGYAEAYDRLLPLAPSWDIVLRAEQAGCGSAYLYSYSKTTQGEQVVKKCELALLLGTPEAAFRLAEIYEKGLYKVTPNKAKAQKYKVRGNQLANRL